MPVVHPCNQLHPAHQIITIDSHSTMGSKSESLPELFDEVKAKFPASLEPDRWYLVAVSRNALPSQYAY